MKLENTGSRVIASAGIIGSGNIREIMTIEIICPKDSRMAMYIKPAK